MRVSINIICYEIKADDSETHFERIITTVLLCHLLYLSIHGFSFTSFCYTIGPLHEYKYNLCKSKGKVEPLYRHSGSVQTLRPTGGVEVWLYYFLAKVLEDGYESASCPGRSLPTRKTPYPLYRRLDGPQDRSGQVRKISPPPGFDPRTVQPLASRYTDWATGPTTYVVEPKILHNFHG